MLIKLNRTELRFRMETLSNSQLGRTSVSKRFRLSHVSPLSYICAIAIIIQCVFFVPPVSAQDYLSVCDTNSKICAKDKFLSCISNKCQCEDTLNQAYDPVLGTCVILAGRKCAGILNSAELLDPRRFNSIANFPTCGKNSECDAETLSCVCRKGYFHNESIGTCELSFGKSCVVNSDNIVFKNPDSSKRGNDSRAIDLSSTISPASLADCDKSLGLICGSEGICKCKSNSVWKIDQGCVLFNGSSGNSNTNKKNADFNAYENNAGNIFNLNPDYSLENYGANEQTPFQQFVDSYTKALIDANNYYTLNQNNADLMGSPFNLTSTDNTLGGGVGVNTSNNVLPTFVGDRNQFPAGGNGGGPATNNGLNMNQNDQLWNLLLLQQEFEKNGNINNIQSNQSISETDLAKLQDQVLQLQKLLAQQQQLQQLVNQLIGPTNSPQTQQNINSATLPSQLLALTNNVVGAGAQNQLQTPINVNSYQPQWNQPQQQQQPPPLFGGAFPFFRLFRSFIDPIKRRLFPNLADAAYSFPSPLYIAASTVNSLLPVLRAFDQQFTPVLENIITLTKPRARPTSPPLLYNNNYPLQQQIQQWNNNNRLALTNSQLYQVLLNSQRLLGGGGLLGSNRNGLGRSRSLNLNLLGGVSQRKARAWNNMFNQNGIGNRIASMSRRLWWWR